MSPLLALALVGIAVVLYVRRGVWYLILANRAFRKNDVEKVLSWFDRAWKIRQLAPDLVCSYAYQLLKAGRTDVADDVLATFAQRGWRNKPLKPKAAQQVRCYQSLVLWKQDRLNDAIDVLQALRGEGYQTTTLYGNLGWFLIEAERWDEAEAVCVEAWEWSPTGKVILDNLATLRLRQGRIAEAQEHYEALLALEPQFPEAWYGAAQVALALDNPETARELLVHALSLPFNALSTTGRDEVERLLASLPTPV